jgi:hypothetical protein
MQVLRDGDRFYFENPDHFTPEEITQIHGMMMMNYHFFFFFFQISCHVTRLL